MRSSTAVTALALACGAADAARSDFGTVIDSLDRREVTQRHAQEHCRGARCDIEVEGTRVP